MRMTSRSHRNQQRHCERSEAIHWCRKCSKRSVDCFVARAPRNDGWTQVRDQPLLWHPNRRSRMDRFLDETAYLFLEAIKLCSVRHNRESNETIHSNEYPQTKTNLSSRPKLGRGT